MLDERGAPVADGATGEIYIGGDGVGRGYRNLPESNARCFVRDPFSEKQGKRMYRTGDRGRRPPDGEIEFCGRSDRHLAFGWAAHFCFGAPLAHMEGQIAFNTLLRNLKNPALLDRKLPMARERRLARPN